jgi:uncharacterized membrane protein YiaA
MNEFGTGLKVFRLRTKDDDSNTRAYLTQARMTELMDLGVSTKQLGHWESGERIIRHTDRPTLLALIAILHQYDGIRSLDEANTWLQSGGYSALTATEIREIDAQWSQPAKTESGSNTAVGTIVSFRALHEWLDTIFDWSGADAHARSSWAGMFIWSITSVSKRLTPHHFVLISGFIVVWIAAIFLMVPILQWPLTDSSGRQEAIILFAVGWMVTPLLLAMFTEADLNPSLTETKQSPIVLFQLKVTGAVVGFGTVFLILLLFAIGWFYISLPQLSWGWRFAILLPLLFGHISARRISADRLKMYDGVLRTHSADKWFLLTFLGIGPLIAVVILLEYPLLENPAIGVGFFLVLLAIALWERHKQRPPSHFDPHNHSE